MCDAMKKSKESFIMNVMSGHALLLLAIGALALLSPAPIHAWQLDDLTLKRAPRWAPRSCTAGLAAIQAVAG